MVITNIHNKLFAHIFSFSLDKNYDVLVFKDLSIMIYFSNIMIEK